MQAGLYHASPSRAIPRGTTDFNQYGHNLPHPDVVHQAHSPFPDAETRSQWATYVIVTHEYSTSQAAILRYLCEKIKDHYGCNSTAYQIGRASRVKERTTQQALSRMVADRVLLPHRAGNSHTTYYLPVNWILDETAWYPNAELAGHPKAPYRMAHEPSQNAESAFTARKNDADSASSTTAHSEEETYILTDLKQDNKFYNYPGYNPEFSSSPRGPRKVPDANSAQTRYDSAEPQLRNADPASTTKQQPHANVAPTSTHQHYADSAEPLPAPPPHFDENYVRQALAFYRALDIQTWNSEDAAVNIYRKDYPRFLRNLQTWQAKHATRHIQTATSQNPHRQDYAASRKPPNIQR